MDDRTLIERAAKAAGIKIKFDAHGVATRRTGKGGNVEVYDPLSRHGQADYLMLKLGISVAHVIHPDGDICAFRGEMSIYEPFKGERVGHRMEATRRAIVRAAASLAMGE